MSLLWFLWLRTSIIYCVVTEYLFLILDIRFCEYRTYKRMNFYEKFTIGHLFHYREEHSFLFTKFKF